jgi:[acyl-carrier-protein] S-malonyltransferase
VTIALFPGQGVQAAGMSEGLHERASDVFALASDVLNVDVAELCRTGTSGEADLGSTRWAQPAVLVCSVASFRMLGRTLGGDTLGGNFRAAAGHSIGEYAALTSANALDLADAVRLVALRARVTEEAGLGTPGGMAAVMKIDREEVDRICAETGIALAADNSAGQYVFSGAVDTLDRALEAFSATKAIARKLDVSAAFHSPVMSPAVEPLRTALDEVTFATPTIELWSSTTAAPISDANEIRTALVQQLTAPVRWRETVTGIFERHGGAFIDIGPGKIVGALVKRIVSGADVTFATDLIGAAA